MTFKQMKAGRIFLAVFAIAAISIVLFIIFYTGYMITRIWDTVANLDPDMTREQQNEVIMDELEKINAEISENPGWLDNLIAVHWFFTAVTAFAIALWTARRSASSPRQATGYGIAIGIGSMLFYGLCVFSSTVNILGQLAMLALLVGFAGMGGQIGGHTLKGRTPPMTDTGVPGISEPMPPGMRSATPGSDATVYFNMGVAAAMGGRREEARQHFRTVLQHQPRHVAAWLQLANLADSPAQAWEYIQQARAISPNDPAVVDAVNMIWPQVQGEVPGAPRVQPPYKGGAMDDTDIPRSTLPGPDLNVPPEPDDDEPPTQ